MDKIRTVVLYGSDLVVSTVGENLRGREGFQIFQIDPLLPDALQRLDAARPDVVLFDLAGSQPDFTITALRKNPGLLLIGVDLGSNKMLVMSGEESQLLTTEDLVQMMETGKSHAQDSAERRPNHESGETHHADMHRAADSDRVTHLGCCPDRGAARSEGG